MAEAAIGGLPDRTPSQPDFSCEIGQAAVRVSLSLKAVHLGTLKVIFRALPRQLEAFITEQIQKIVERAGVKFFAKKMAVSFTGLGSIIGVAIGAAAAMDYMLKMEQVIHDVLGCKPNAIDHDPMRYDFGEIIKGIKQRTWNKARPVDKVSTRKIPKK